MHSEVSAVKVEEMMGYLWPLPLFNAKFKNETADPKCLSTVMHHGRAATGVTKSPEHGWHPSVLRLTSISQSPLGR